MNGKAHAMIGLLAGTDTGLALSIEANRRPAFAEVCGWSVGGVGGAKLPDILEPAIHPSHRKFCPQWNGISCRLCVSPQRDYEELDSISS